MEKQADKKEQEDVFHDVLEEQAPESTSTCSSLTGHSPVFKHLLEDKEDEEDEYFDAQEEQEEQEDERAASYFVSILKPFALRILQNALLKAAAGGYLEDVEFGRLLIEEASAVYEEKSLIDKVRRLKHSLDRNVDHSSSYQTALRDVISLALELYEGIDKSNLSGNVNNLEQRALQLLNNSAVIQNFGETEWIQSLIKDTHILSQVYSSFMSGSSSEKDMKSLMGMMERYVSPSIQPMLETLTDSYKNINLAKKAFSDLEAVLDSEDKIGALKNKLSDKELVGNIVEKLGLGSIVHELQSLKGIFDQFPTADKDIQKVRWILKNEDLAETKIGKVLTHFIGEENMDTASTLADELEMLLKIVKSFPSEGVSDQLKWLSESFFKNSDFTQSKIGFFLLEKAPQLSSLQYLFYHGGSILDTLSILLDSTIEPSEKIKKLTANMSGLWDVYDVVKRIKDSSNPSKEILNQLANPATLEKLTPYISNPEMKRALDELVMMNKLRESFPDSGGYRATIDWVSKNILNNKELEKSTSGQFLIGQFSSLTDITSVSHEGVKAMLEAFSLSVNPDINRYDKTKGMINAVGATKVASGVSQALSYTPFGATANTIFDIGQLISTFWQVYNEYDGKATWIEIIDKISGPALNVLKIGEEQRKKINFLLNRVKRLPTNGDTEELLCFFVESVKKYPGIEEYYSNYINLTIIYKLYTAYQSGTTEQVRKELEGLADSLRPLPLYQNQAAQFMLSLLPMLPEIYQVSTAVSQVRFGSSLLEWLDNVLQCLSESDQPEIVKLKHQLESRVENFLSSQMLNALSGANLSLLPGADAAPTPTDRGQQPSTTEPEGEFIKYEASTAPLVAAVSGGIIGAVLILESSRRFIKVRSDSSAGYSSVEPTEKSVEPTEKIEMEVLTDPPVTEVPSGKSWRQYIVPTTFFSAGAVTLAGSYAYYNQAYNRPEYKLDDLSKNMLNPGALDTDIFNEDSITKQKDLLASLSKEQLSRLAQLPGYALSGGVKEFKTRVWERLYQDRKNVTWITSNLEIALKRVKQQQLIVDLMSKPDKRMLREGEKEAYNDVIKQKLELLINALKEARSGRISDILMFFAEDRLDDENIAIELENEKLLAEFLSDDEIDRETYDEIFEDILVSETITDDDLIDQDDDEEQTSTEENTVKNRKPRSIYDDNSGESELEDITTSLEKIHLDVGSQYVSIDTVLGIGFAIYRQSMLRKLAQLRKKHNRLQEKYIIIKSNGVLKQGGEKRIKAIEEALVIIGKHRARYKSIVLGLNKQDCVRHGKVLLKNGNVIKIKKNETLDQYLTRWNKHIKESLDLENNDDLKRQLSVTKAFYYIARQMLPTEMNPIGNNIPPRLKNFDKRLKLKLKMSSAMYIKIYDKLSDLETEVVEAEDAVSRDIANNIYNVIKKNDASTIMYGNFQRYRPKNYVPTVFKKMKENKVLPDVLQFDSSFIGYDEKYFSHNHMWSHNPDTFSKVDPNAKQHYQDFRSKLKGTGMLLEKNDENGDGEFHYVFTQNRDNEPEVLPGVYLYRYHPTSSQYIYVAKSRTLHMTPKANAVEIILTGTYKNPDGNTFSDNSVQKLLTDLYNNGVLEKATSVDQRYRKLLLPKYKSVTVRDLLYKQNKEGIVFPHTELKNTDNGFLPKSFAAQGNEVLDALNDKNLQKQIYDESRKWFTSDDSKHQIIENIDTDLSRVDEYRVQSLSDGSSSYEDEAIALLDKFNQGKSYANDPSYEYPNSATNSHRWDHYNPGLLYIPSDESSSRVEGIFVGLESKLIIPVPADLHERIKMFNENKLLHSLYTKNMSFETKRELKFECKEESSEVSGYVADFKHIPFLQPSEYLARFELDASSAKNSQNTRHFYFGVAQGISGQPYTLYKLIVRNLLRKSMAGYIQWDSKERTAFKELYKLVQQNDPDDNLSTGHIISWTVGGSKVSRKEAPKRQAYIWERFLDQESDRQMVSAAEERTIKFVNDFKPIFQAIMAAITLPLSFTMGPAASFGLSVLTGASLDFVLDMAKAVSIDDPDKSAAAMKQAVIEISIALALEIGGEAVSGLVPVITKGVKNGLKKLKVGDDVLTTTLKASDIDEIQQMLKTIPSRNTSDLVTSSGDTIKLSPELKVNIHKEMDKVELEFYPKFDPRDDQGVAARELEKRKKAHLYQLVKENRHQVFLGNKKHKIDWNDQDWLAFLAAKNEGVQTRPARYQTYVIESWQEYISRRNRGKSIINGKVVKNWWERINRKALAENEGALDKRIISKADNGNKEFSRVCYLSAINVAEQSGELTKGTAASLRAISDGSDVMSTEGYKTAFGLDNSASSTLKKTDIQQSGFIHVGTRNPDGTIKYNHVVYAYVIDGKVHLYQSNDMAFQMAVGEFTPVGRTSTSRTTWDSDTKVDLTKYESVHPNTVYKFTPVDEVRGRAELTRIRDGDVRVKSGDVGNARDVSINSEDSIEIFSMGMNDTLMGRIASLRDAGKNVEVRGYTNKFKGDKGVEAISIHGDPDGKFYYTRGGAPMNAEQLVASFIKNNIDLTMGKGPIHLLSCYAKSSGAAQDLAKATGRVVIGYSNRSVKTKSLEVLEEWMSTPQTVKSEVSQWSPIKLFTDSDYKPPTPRKYTPGGKTGEKVHPERDDVGNRLKQQEIEQANGLREKLGLVKPKTSEPIFEPNEFVGSYKLIGRTKNQQEYIDEIKDIVLKDIKIQNYMGNPQEKCKDAAERVIGLIKGNRDVESITIKNMAIWNTPIGKEAEMFDNHWVIIVRYKGTDMVIDPTAEQFSKYGIKSPIFDTLNNWIAIYQEAFSKKSNLLVKMVDVENFDSAPFASNKQLSGFQHVEGAQTVSDARWNTSEGLRQNREKAEMLARKNTEQAKRDKKQKEAAWRNYRQEMEKKENVPNKDSDVINGKPDKKAQKKTEEKTRKEEKRKKVLGNKRSQVSSEKAIDDFEALVDTAPITRPFVSYPLVARGDMNVFKYIQYLPEERRPLVIFEYSVSDNPLANSINRNIPILRQHLDTSGLKEGQDYIFAEEGIGSNVRKKINIQSNAALTDLKNSQTYQSSVPQIKDYLEVEITKTVRQVRNYKEYDNILSDNQVLNDAQRDLVDTAMKNDGVKDYLKDIDPQIMLKLKAREIGSDIISPNYVRENDLIMVNINKRTPVSDKWDPREMRHATDLDVTKKILEVVLDTPTSGSKKDICIVGSGFNETDKDGFRKFGHDNDVTVYFLNDMVDKGLNRKQQRAAQFAFADRYRSTTYFGMQSGVNEDAVVLPRTNVLSMSEYLSFGQPGIGRVEARTQLDQIGPNSATFGGEPRTTNIFYSLRENEFLSTEGIFAAIQLKKSPKGQSFKSLNQVWDEASALNRTTNGDVAMTEEVAARMMYEVIFDRKASLEPDATESLYMDALRVIADRKMSSNPVELRQVTRRRLRHTLEQIMAPDTKTKLSPSDKQDAIEKARNDGKDPYVVPDEQKHHRGGQDKEDLYKTLEGQDLYGEK